MNRYFSHWMDKCALKILFKQPIILTIPDHHFSKFKDASKQLVSQNKDSSTSLSANL